MFKIIIASKFYIKTTLLSCCLSKSNLLMTTKRPSSDLVSFRKEFAKAKRIVILTGAGVSAESGVPTFRGAGGLWRIFKAQDLATPEKFYENPSLVWEFYHYRREVMLSKKPNPAHFAISECEKRLQKENRNVVVVTQNIDELHKRAGSEKIIELHGSLFKTRCTKCHRIEENYDSPICESLRNRGCPDPSSKSEPIPIKDLPKCKECGSLVRPHVVWFGENLDVDVLKETDQVLDNCDLCLIVGTSSVVYPAAMFAPQVASRGVTVAEFNIENTGATSEFNYHFSGPCGELLPKALASTT